MKNPKKQTSDDRFQAWSDEETNKLLNFWKKISLSTKKVKKSEFYAMVSRSIIKTKTIK
jgi:hypothetical protein